MHELPHHYAAVATAEPKGDVGVDSDGLPSLATAPPPEFDGPGDRWSPETLLVGSVANCFILTFRAVARASDFDWVSLRCEVDGALDRVDRGMRFTEFRLRVTLQVPEGADEERARRLLDKAERGCLITNSMTAETHLDATVETAA